MSLEDFLKKYYRQLHFNSMKPEVLARLQELIKKDSLTDKQRNWVRDYMELNANGKYVPKALPDTTSVDDLPDDVAKELFLTCQNALVGMNGARVTFKDTDPQSRDFVDEYFGPGKMFNIAPASQECEAGIRAIVNLIRTNPTVKRYLLAQEADGKKIFDNETKLDEFLGKCDRSEYNTKGAVQSKVKRVAEALDRATWGFLPDELMPIQANKTHINNIIDDKAFAMDPASITTAQLDDFRQNIKEDTGILQTLYKNKTIRSRFAKYDDGTITGVIESKAEDEVDYQKSDSDNYLTPKYEDVLTPLQWLEKQVTDTYNNTLRKYEELRGGHNFFSNEAQDICKAIDKVSDKTKDEANKITPVNGLSKLLERASDVKAKLASNPVAKQHFDWFVETMNGVKDDIPKAIDGCWKNAWQMKCVIEKIILRATDPANDDVHAMEKAKTAMEIMTVMKYGMLTSKVMDAMKTTEFSIFSDGNLSWNKNEYIKNITTAFDFSVKKMFQGLGYGVTIVRNKIMMSGMKFKNKNNQDGLLGARVQQEEARLASLNATSKQHLQTEIQNKTNERTGHEQIIQNFAAQGVNQTTINQDEQTKANIEQQLDPFKQQKDAASDEMKTHSDEMQRQQDIIDEKQASYDEYSRQDDIIHDRDIDAKVNDLQAQLNANTQRINNINAILNAPQLLDPQGNPLTGRAKIAYKRHLYDELGQLYDDSRQKTNDINTANAGRNNQRRQNAARAQQAQLQNDVNAYNQALAARQQAENAYNAAQNRYNNADVQYNNIVQNTGYQAISDRIEQFNSAHDAIEELNGVIEEKQNAYDNWDNEHLNKVIELENHWNFLQGKTKTWRLNSKKAQDKFNSNKQVILQNYVNDYGLAA